MPRIHEYKSGAHPNEYCDGEGLDRHQSRSSHARGRRGNQKQSIQRQREPECSGNEEREGIGPQVEELKVRDMMNVIGCGKEEEAKTCEMEDARDISKSRL